MGIDTETTNVGVSLKGDKNNEGPDGKAGGKVESNIEQTKKGTNKSKMNNKTKTEEATSMGADTEAIGSGAQSGLLDYVVGFHTKVALASKSMEEETNTIVNSKSMSKNTQIYEKACKVQYTTLKTNHIQLCRRARSHQRKMQIQHLTLLVYHK